MTSTLILDKSQPELAKLVAGWKDGGEYTLELRVKQLSSDDGATTLRVLEVASDDEDGMEQMHADRPKTMMKMGAAPANVTDTAGMEE